MLHKMVKYLYELIVLEKELVVNEKLILSF